MSLNLTDFFMETERLHLVPVSPAFKEDIFRELTDEITRYMCPRPPEKMEDTETFILGSELDLRQGKNLITAVLQKQNGVFLGCAGLHRPFSPHPELGIWIKGPAHGHGYGKEAIFALKDWADEHLEYEYLTYPVDIRNISSRRIPEALGGIIDGTYDQVSQSGRQLHILVYKLFPK